jgi:hypothetical protein
MFLSEGRGDGRGLRSRPEPGVGGPAVAGLGSRAGLRRTTSATNSAIHSAILLDTISSRPCSMRMIFMHLNQCMLGKVILSRRAAELAQLMLSAGAAALRHSL